MCWQSRTPLLAALGLGLTLLTACHDPAAYREKIEASVDRALESGNPDLAVGLLQAALERDPRDAASARHLAELYLETQEVWRALSVLQSLPAGRPRDRAFLLTHAEVLVRADYLDRAARVLLAIEAPDADLLDRFFERVAGSLAVLEEELPAAWMLRLVELEIGTDDLTSATIYVERIDPLDPARAPLLDILFQRLLASGHLGTAAQLPNLFAGPSTAYQLLARQRIALTRGEHPLAAELERRFLTDHPDHPGRAPLLIESARRAIAGGDHSRALALAREAGAVDPRSSEPLFLQGLALHQLADDDSARRRLGAALAIDPRHRGARDLLDRIDPARNRSLTLKIAPDS